jgi:CHASE3 domain sensor protein
VNAAKSRRLDLLDLAMAMARLLSVSFLSYRDWKQYRLVSARTLEARQIFLLNETLVDCMRDAGTGQRGFLLTGRPEYLEPYTAAVEQVPADIAALSDLRVGAQNVRIVILLVTVVLAALVGGGGALRRPRKWTS